MRVRLLPVLICLAGLAIAGACEAQARAGFGGSFGSRGARSFSVVPSTRTAPSVAPLGTQPGLGNQGLLRPSIGSRGLFGGFGRGLIGGFLGAGLFGLLFGHGFFGGAFSLFGFLLQLALIALLVRFAIGYFRRQSPLASAGPTNGASFRSPGPSSSAGPSHGFARAGAPRTIVIEPADYARFETALTNIQNAFSDEDVTTLRRWAIPRMADEFASELQENQARGLVNRMSDVRFLSGDLAESWRESGTDYASVAIRYSLIDATIRRNDGYVVAGDAHRPEIVTEVWTFARPAGGASDSWLLSAIQQTR